MNIKIFFFFALITLYSCSETKTKNTILSTESTRPLEVDNNIALALESFSAFNAHKWEEHSAFFSDSCQNLDPSYGANYVIVNRKDKAAKYKEMESWSPDIKDSITHIFGSADKVTIQFISSGTAKTNKGQEKWSLPICCVFTFKNGLIVCDETYYDRGK